jgi:N-acetylneuraminic acid mutarotase
MKKLLGAITIMYCMVSVSAQTEGTFPIIFKNLATETFADSQIYIYSVGSGGGMNYHVDKNGAMQPFRKADADAPGHITRNGILC